MNVSEVQNKISEWVRTESGYPVVWERPNAPRQDRAYIGILVLALVPTGTAYISPPDTNGIAEIVGHSIMSLSLSSYLNMDAARLNAINVLEELRLSLWKESVKLLFNDTGIGYLATTNNQNMGQIVGTEFEQRGVMDMNFMISSSITDDVGIIEQVEGVGEYYDVTGQLNHSVGFNAEI